MSWLTNIRLIQNTLKSIRKNCFVQKTDWVIFRIFTNLSIADAFSLKLVVHYLTHRTYFRTKISWQRLIAQSTRLRVLNHPSLLYVNVVHLVMLSVLRHYIIHTCTRPGVNFAVSHHHYTFMYSVKVHSDGMVGIIWCL